MSSPSPSPADVSPSPPPTPPRHMMLSSAELSLMMNHPDMPTQLSTTFNDDPTITMALRYYCFMSHSIERLEEDLERHRREQSTVFDNLIRRQRFRDRITPVVQNYRRQNMRPRFHPYNRTPSPVPTPSNSDSDEPPSEIEVRSQALSYAAPSPPPRSPHRHPIRRSPYASQPPSPKINRPLSPLSDDASRFSFHTADDGLAQETGTQHNPIVIGDDDDTQEPDPIIPYCVHCFTHGHWIDDCTATVCSHCEQIGHKYGVLTCPQFNVWRMKSDGTYLTPAGRAVGVDYDPNKPLVCPHCGEVSHHQASKCMKY